MLQSSKISNKSNITIDIINDIKDDPQGGYDESEIENEVSGRVDEWKNNITEFIKSYGYDNDFILDFIDIDELTDKIVSSDGYGGILNSYDGDYDTYDINENTYYVMRASQDFICLEFYLMFRMNGTKKENRIFIKY